MRRRFHLAYPFGGGLNADAITWASKSPVIFAIVSGVILVFRFKAASSPSSQYVFRILLIVGSDTPNISDSSRLLFFLSGKASFVFNRIFACIIVFADECPF